MGKALPSSVELEILNPRACLGSLVLSRRDFGLAYLIEHWARNLKDV
jgi:hypothetical protein